MKENYELEDELHDNILKTVRNPPEKSFVEEFLEFIDDIYTQKDKKEDSPSNR